MSSCIVGGERRSSAPLRRNDPWSGVNPIRARPRPQGNDNGGRSSARNDVLALGANSLTHLWGRPGLAKHRFELCPGLPWSFWKTSFRFG